MAVLKKPYEISIWGNELVTEDGVSYYQENKITNISNDNATSLNKDNEYNYSTDNNVYTSLKLLL